jgi:hypothetical protein
VLYDTREVNAKSARAKTSRENDSYIATFFQKCFQLFEFEKKIDFVIFWWGTDKVLIFSQIQKVFLKKYATSVKSG